MYQLPPTTSIYSQYNNSNQTTLYQQNSQDQESANWPNTTMSAFANKNEHNNRDLLNNLYESTEEQNLCKKHGKLYEYVCCSCMELKCKMCISQSCRDGGQLVWNQHEVLTFKNYHQRLQVQSKNHIDSKMQEYYIANYQDLITRKANSLHESIQAMQIQSQKSIALIQQNMHKFKELMISQIQKLEQIYEKTIQGRKRQLHNDQILQEIAYCGQEGKAATLIVQNWRTLKSLSKNKGQKKQEKQSQSQTEKIFAKCNEMEHFMKKSYSIVEGELLKVNKSMDDYQNWAKKSTFTSMIKSSSSTNLTPQKKSKSPRTPTSSNLSLTPLLVKKQRSFLGGITNIINQQMHKLPTVAHKNQVERIQLYGGNYKGKLVEIYHPWKQAKKQKNLISQAVSEIKDGYSHIGFGDIIFESKNNQLCFVVVGGYLNGEITDCIFRINQQKRKKQLIGRLDQPLAYFGYSSRKLKKQNGQKYSKLFICGGQCQKSKPVSYFYCYQFAQNLAIIKRQELPRFDQPRHSLTLTLHKSDMYAVGGIDFENNALKTVERFCFETKLWSRVGDLCYQRSNHRTVSLKTGLYVIGGWNGHNYLRSVERFCQNKQSFQIVMELKEPRSNFGCLPCNDSNSIFILGGNGEQELSSCEYLCVREKSSAYIKPLPFPRSNFSVWNF